MVQVVAAIIQREGKILIGRRQKEQAHSLKWEFPGGKLEPDEKPEQALARELEEELGIRGAAGQEMTRYDYTYPGRDAIRLFFFRVTEYQGEPVNRIFHELRWEPVESLRDFDFVEGDIEFLRGLTAGAY
jgi:8-oxo-dGTP diphosphatase